MKILTTTYFKDFARYFNYLENEICKIEKNIEIYNISIYPCAHHYWTKHNKHSILLPSYVSEIKVNKISNISGMKTYKGIDLEKIINFNYTSQKMYGLNKKRKLKIQAVKYIEFFDNLFRSNKFDLFISSGDSRMLVEISVALAKKYNVKIYYFEQGPFGTTMIDEKGVNCNISFIDREELNFNIDESKLKNYIDNYKNNKKEKYWKYEEKSLLDKYYDFKTFYWMYPCKLIDKFVPIDTQIGSPFFNSIYPILKNKLISKKVETKKEFFPENAITFIMQVPVDAQLIDNSPLYSDFFTMLKDIHSSIPKGYNLVIREHPNYLNKYDKRIYQYIASNENIYLLNNISLDETLNKSTLIVLNNSTVGIEALTYYKTVITLGNSYYNRKNVTYNLVSRDDLSVLLEKGISDPISKKSINTFLYNFIFDYLIQGHFQDKELKNADIVISKLLDNT